VPAPRNHDDPRALFGRAVRALRLKKGLSQEALAASAEIHRTYIGDVERGTRNIALLNMVKIANALGVSLARLIADMERGRNED
jgi:transcriptional regulator with XRE-family HTH domain